MTTEADLIFSPQANHNFSRILTDLKRANLSIANRLRSIRADASFVEDVARTFGDRPVIANERCGSWYVPPSRKAGSAYFKSTDGHAGQWNFSARRLNLHLLSLISGNNKNGKNGKGNGNGNGNGNDGCIIVDSTRRGKAMPDALSKTIPIWCAVLNRLAFPDLVASNHNDNNHHDHDHHALHTPPAVVSRSEHALAEARIPAHVEALKALNVIDPAALRALLGKPLRPLWVTQGSLLPGGSMMGFDDDGDGSGNNGGGEGNGGGVIFEDAIPVICCTSSRRVVGGEMSEGGYIQGAGDDTENWALGLTASLFWENVDALLAVPEADLPDFVRKLVAEAQLQITPGSSGLTGPVALRVAPCLFVGALSAASERARATCTVMLVPKTTDPNTWLKTPTLMEVGVGKQQKIAGRNLRVALPAVCDFVGAHLLARREETPDVKAAIEDGRSSRCGDGNRILILCETGKDLSIGVALAIACRFFDDDDNNGNNDDEGNYYNPRPPEKGVNKNQIKMRLGRIMMALADANPSRATLQSVNSYLMG